MARCARCHCALAGATSRCTTSRSAGGAWALRHCHELAGSQRSHQGGERGEHAGVVVDRTGAGEGQPGLARPPRPPRRRGRRAPRGGRLVNPCGHTSTPSARPSPRARAITARTSGPEPRLRRCGPRSATPAPSPPTGAGRRAAATAVGARPELVLVRVAVGDGAHREAVRGEQHLGALGQARRALASTSRGEEVDQRRLVGASCRSWRRATPAAAARSRAVVLADAGPAVVRREHEADDRRRRRRPASVATASSMNGARVLLAEHDAVAPSPSAGSEPRPLRLGACGERRDAADGVVPPAQVGQLLGRRAAGRGGCACSTPRRRRATPACRTPSRRRRRVTTCTVPSSCTSATTSRQHAGVGLGQHAVAEVEDVAGWPPFSASTARARRRPPATGRGTRPGRGCPAAPCPARPVRGRAERRAPVDADDLGAGLAHEAEQLAGVHAEVDAGHAEVGQPANTRRAGGQHEPAVVGGRERAGPAVEELHGAGAGLDLRARATRRRGRPGGRISVVPQVGLAEHERLGLRVGARRPRPRSGSSPP